MTVPPSKTLERYELIDRIAVGGMAEVFRAVAYGAHGFEKSLAIKRILPELAQDPEFEARFIDEAKLAVQLTHANVVQVFDFGRFGGSLFIAMEYVDGLDLAALLKIEGEREERISVPAAFHISIEIARGLDFAHQHNVVHRDVSPSNILLSKAGEVKIADFGIAQAASEQRRKRGGRRRIMGKWRYMSPEQTKGETLSTQSDIFSAAAVMYEVFTGKKLFPGEEAEDIIKNIHRMEIPRASEVRPGLPPRLDEVLARALERDPTKRPSKPGEMVRALAELSYESSVVATALDVAETVAGALQDAQPAPGAPAGRALDDLIRKQLGGAGGSVVARRTAVEDPLSSDSVIALEPTELAGDSGVDEAEDGEDGEQSSAADRPPTIVKRGVDVDGVTLWELEDSPVVSEATVRAVPSAIRHGKQSGSVRAIPEEERSQRTLTRVPQHVRAVVVALVLLGLGAGIGAWAIWRRSRQPELTRLPEPAAFDAGSSSASPNRLATLSLDSVPRGASVWVDGERLPAPTPTAASVTAGEPHQVEMEAEGYRRWSMDGITLRPGETFPVAPDLPPLLAALEVTTNPPGAKVKLDGELIGRTPLERSDLRPGKGQTLLLTKTGFQPLKLEVDLAAGKPARIERELKPVVRYGKISIYIEPGWANVYLNGKKVGRAPQKNIELPLGKHELRLHNPHSGKEKTIEVEVVEDKVEYYRVTW